MATPGKYGRIAGLVLHVLLGGLMIMAGAMKLAGKMPPEATQKMPPGIASHLMLIGAGELFTAILLIVPFTSSLGVLLASGFWGGVICIQMAGGNDFIMPSVFLLLDLGRGVSPQPERVLQLFRLARRTRPRP